jgi:NAD-dependent DNA ligase
LIIFFYRSTIQLALICNATHTPIDAGTMSVPRADVQARIEVAGGRVSAAVTPKTDYLVNGVGKPSTSAKRTTMSTKERRAEKFGTVVIGEEELHALIDAGA